MKKLVVYLLTAVMILGLLAGCGSEPAAEEKTEGAAQESNASEAEVETEADAETEAETEANAEKEADASEKTTIKVYREMMTCPSVNDEQTKKVQDKVNELLAAKGASVEIELHEYASSEYPDKVNNELLSGDVNIMWNSSWVQSVNTDNIWRSNGAYDITDLVKDTALYNAMPENVWQAAMYDGRILFIPIYKETYEGYDLRTRKALCDEYGWDESFSDVKKLADIEPYLEQVKDLRYPYHTENKMFARFNLDKYDSSSISGRDALLMIDRDSDEVIKGIETDGYKEYTHLIANWYDKGYISPDEVTGIENGMNKTQDWGFCWWTCVPGDEAANASSRDEQEEVIIEGITGKWVHSTTTLGSCYTIAASCTEEQAKACIEFLGYVYTDNDIANVYTFGIEGEDFTFDDNGRVVLADDLKYNHQAWESTSFAVLTLLDTEPENKVEDYLEKNGAAQTSSAAGFRFDKTPVEGQWNACSAIADEIGRPLELGGYSEDKVDETIEDFIAQLYAAGFEDIYNEAVKQYNDWKAE